MWLFLAANFREPILGTSVNKGSNSKSRGFLTAPALTHLALEFSVSRLAPLVYDNLTGCDLWPVRH